MNKIIVNIPEEESKKVEFLFYKYNSLMAILNYLYERNQADEEYLDKKLTELTYLCIDLENMKNSCSQKYKPAEIQDDDFKYTFNFNDCAIVYEVD